MAAGLFLITVVAGGVPAVPSSAAAESARVAARADTWKAPVGPAFNSPNASTPSSRLTILKRINDAIRHAPRGSVIRFSTYSIDRADTVKYLGQAHARGVKVQIVVNDNIVSPVQLRLQKRLGRSAKNSNFMIICKAACRNNARGGNQHMKTYSFSKTGASDYVIINSSANLTGGAVNGQWNDSYTVAGNKALFDSWVNIFRQQSLDRAASPRRVSYRSETLSVHYQRVKGGQPTTRETVSVAKAATTGDAPLDRVNLVSCRAKPGFGAGGRTVIRVAMYAWYGTRGERIARALAKRKSEGCQVAVIGSVMSKQVIGILRAGRIPVKAADWDFGQKLATSGKGMVYGPRCYMHLKFMTLSGTYKGVGTAVTFTGSENWSAPSLSSDEVTYEIHDRRVAAQYTDKWKRMWASNSATHPVYREPRTRPCKG